MCFHFKQSKSKEEFEINDIKGEPINGVYNGFSYPKVSSITDENPNSLSDLQWGLIPSWAKSDDIKKYTLNARVETLDEKPSFKNAKRCVIFSDGFYEWKWLDSKGKRKQKYLIEYPESVLFGFAGLYDQWIDKKTGEIIKSCSIVTTSAEGIMKEIHNSKLRMPVTLIDNQLREWLNGEKIKFFSDYKVTAC